MLLKKFPGATLLAGALALYTLGGPIAAQEMSPATTNPGDASLEYQEGEL